MHRRVDRVLGRRTRAAAARYASAEDSSFASKLGAPIIELVDKTPETFPKGAAVVIKGLSSRGDLNGRTAHVATGKVHAKTGRVAVVVAGNKGAGNNGEGEKVLIKPANLGTTKGVLPGGANITIAGHLIVEEVVQILRDCGAAEPEVAHMRGAAIRVTSVSEKKERIRYTKINWFPVLLDNLNGSLD